MILLVFSLLMSTQQTSFLDDLQWQNRVILICDTTDETEMVEEQKVEYKSNREEFLERDIIVYLITDNEVLTYSGRPVPNSSAEDVRDKFSINNQAFTTVLIGKDGTSKLKVNYVVTADELINLIDNMPMRRREMKEDY